MFFLQMCPSCMPWVKLGVEVVRRSGYVETGISAFGGSCIASAFVMGSSYLGISGGAS